MSALPPELLEEAAAWLLALRYDAPDATQRQAFECWREQSDAHRAAWTRAERVLGTCEAVPPAIGRQALRRLEEPAGPARRQALRLLAGALLLAPAAGLVLREAPLAAWRADVRTATGERRRMTLADDSLAVLNTASALDVRFDTQCRTLRLLQGEVLVTTHPDSQRPPRPFAVAVAQGQVEALGTRFSVRQRGELCQVAVFTDRVRLRPIQGAPLVLAAGQQAWFAADGVRRTALVDASASLWETGMLLVRDGPLVEVLAELARYRPGVLRCDPTVAQLRVSGALSLVDTDQALAALARSLPLQVTRVTRYWTSVAAR